MIALITAGLVMGMIGSLHCVGMCGPIALSLPVVSNSPIAPYAGTFLYNIGRVICYALIGLLMGMIGKAFHLVGFQQWLSLTIGLALLIYIVIPAKTKNEWGKMQSFMQPLRSKMSVLFQTKSYRSLFLIGFLNGLLPCGLVYVAMAGALAYASALESSMFMASFGLGTLPMMWLVAFTGAKLKWSFRTQIRKAYPFVIAVMAVLLIIRGLGLGIPYLSPSLESKHSSTVTVECH